MMDSLALRKRMLPPSTKMAACAVSLRPWPLSNTLLSFILASLLTGVALIPKIVGLIKLGKQVKPDQTGPRRAPLGSVFSAILCFARRAEAPTRVPRSLPTRGRFSFL